MARASVPGAQGKPSYTESALLLQLIELLLLFYFVYFSECPSSFQKKIAVVTNILLVMEGPGKLLPETYARSSSPLFHWGTEDA